MCFKPPKPPKTTDMGADPELTRQRQAAELDAEAIKADNKQARMEQQLALQTGRMGRRSLFSGGQGGIGFPGRARLFNGSPVGAQPPVAPVASSPAPASPGAGGGSIRLGIGSGRRIFRDGIAGTQQQ